MCKNRSPHFVFTRLKFFYCGYIVTKLILGVCAGRFAYTRLHLTYVCVDKGPKQIKGPKNV